MDHWNWPPCVRILANTPDPLFLFVTREERAAVETSRLQSLHFERRDRLRDQRTGETQRPVCPFVRFFEKVQLQVITDETPDWLWQAWFDPPDSDDDDDGDDATADEGDSDADTLVEEPECAHDYDFLLSLNGRLWPGYCSYRNYLERRFGPQGAGGPP
ncbi:uncharacterized protein LOC62_01G000052 [Vanrija pseudolonga]|uniref:Uncharacterized protein n=1 Tax=Vanrija pseudolonga TaxID=143232 RepID=A0AAF0Y2H8_9TREE|nr:hypothetical protein LOC62_01G000052 [Vanrija pseudolonga]